VSSHLMSEMALTADHLVVIGRGHLISTGTVPDFIAQSTSQFVRVRSPRSSELARLLTAEYVQVTSEEDGALSVSGMSADDIGDLAGASGIYLHELSPQMASLEDAFMELTRDSVEYHGVSDPDRVTSVSQTLISES
jgi:ABC-2 type transport system ATP-binding protein